MSTEIPSENQINNLKRLSLAGQWFHISCGFNPDNNILYMITIINGVENYIDKELKPEIIYTNLSSYIGNTSHFKKINKY